MTYCDIIFILLSQVLALFMMLLIQTTGHKMAVLMVVFAPFRT